LALKNFSKAAETYKELESNLVTFTATDFRKYGQASFLSKDTLNAITKFKKAIEMDRENNCNLMFSVGTLLSSMKDYAGSTEILKLRMETATCQDSVNTKALYVIGTNFLFSNAPDSAIVYLEKNSKLDPRNIFADIYIGDALIQTAKIKEGIEKYKSVLAKHAGDSSLNKNGVIQTFAKLSNYYLDQKNYVELNKIAKQWTDVYPDNAFGFLYLAVSYQGQGDKENACRNYGKVLKLDPNNGTAKKNRDLMGCGQ
jgi:tetratricopeptide (TPR) repeat protein